MIVEVGPAIEQIKELRQYLPEKTKEELAQILAFGEKMKAEGEKKEKEFWNKYLIDSDIRKKFKNLLIKYEDTKEKFTESLAPNEKKMLENLEGIVEDKFYDEYLYERILYSGEINSKYNDVGEIKYRNENGNFEIEKFRKWVNDSKNKLKPGMIIYLFNNNIGYEGVKNLAESWKDSLKPGMEIYLGYNEIGNEGVKILAEAWKNSLKPGMKIDLNYNDIGDEGVKVLAETWKDSLKPGIGINLGGNGLSDDGVKNLAESWKDSLKPGMEIYLRGNSIGDEGVKSIAKNIKLKHGMYFNLNNCGVTDIGAIELSKMELQEGCILNLGNNHIGAEGARAIIDNLKLKNRCELYILGNNFSNVVKDELRRREQDNIAKGINCKVHVSKNS